MKTSLSMNPHAIYCRERYRNEEEFRRKQLQRTIKSRKKRENEGFIPWEKRPENKIRVREIQKKYREKLRLQILTHYSGGQPKCAHCNCHDDRVLTIDHINGNGNKHRRNIGAGTGFYAWLKRNNFPEGFQVLCMNCNWLKRMESDKHD
jgi:hypothetical protein